MAQEHLYSTIALCPECLRSLKAEVFADEGGEVWMERTCPEHGTYRTRIWPDVEHFKWLTSRAMPKTAPHNTISTMLQV